MKSGCHLPELEASTVQPGTRIKKSRVGKWRALVLVAVNLAIVAHALHWFATREPTLTPLEPSESMAFTKEGTVNAGLILFALAILSTLVLGRWFCGWACHIVALQDASAWLLKKLRLKPRAVNLGILGWVPWLAFVYMFLMPLAWRLLHGRGLAEPVAELYTDDFWKTFPNWGTGLLTCAVVGFGIVWFLGAKGFCNYGCPYGGIFGIVDQAAPLRIRVTDACSGCGHCTAVCTSNVKVHQEVRDWKTVVDPACMKCLDCVSVCPKDALYVGWGAPALVAQRRAPAPAPSAARARAARGFWAETLLLFVFFAGSMAAFLASNPPRNEYEHGLTLVLAGFALLVALPFRGRAERRSEYTLGEELALAGLFVFGLFGMRGAQLFEGLGPHWTISFPFLFALGMAAIFAYVVVQAARVLRRSNLSLARLALRANDAWRPAGLLLVVLAGAWTTGCAVHTWNQLQAPRRAPDPERIARANASFQAGVQHAAANRLVDAEREFRATLALVPEFIEARENLAGMLCAQGRFREGAAEYEQALQLRPEDAGTWQFLGRARAGIPDLAGARQAFEQSLTLARAQRRADLELDAHGFLAEICLAQGDQAGAAQHQRAFEELQRRPR